MTRPLRVLVIDDDVAALWLAEEAFALLEQPCTLTTASSGPIAWASLTSRDAVLPDLVLLDLHMPGMDGLAVLAQMKANAALCALPVMMFTTSTAPEEIVQAYALRANAYLPKAVHFETFLEQMRSMITFWTQTRLTTWPEL